MNGLGLANVGFLAAVTPAGDGSPTVSSPPSIEGSYIWNQDGVFTTFHAALWTGSPSLTQTWQISTDNFASDVNDQGAYADNDRLGYGKEHPVGGLNGYWVRLKEHDSVSNITTYSNVIKVRVGPRIYSGGSITPVGWTAIGGAGAEYDGNDVYLDAAVTLLSVTQFPSLDGAFDFSSCTSGSLANLSILNQPDIGSIGGLYALTSMTSLALSDVGISDWDFSPLVNLQALYCTHNNITSINLSANTALDWLVLSNNNLSTLDLTSNPGISDLDVSFNPLLSAITAFTSLTGLIYLNLSSTGMSAPMPGDFPSLTSLLVSDMGLTALDISGWSLGYFYADSNAFDTIAMDNIMVALAANGIHNGFASLSDNSPISLTGLTAKGTLEDNGWTVNVSNIMPYLEGDTSIGGILTCNPGVWDGNASPSASYQWRDENGDIAGETSNTYISRPYDFGMHIYCRVTSSAPRDSNTVQIVLSGTQAIAFVSASAPSPAINDRANPYGSVAAALAGLSGTGMPFCFVAINELNSPESCNWGNDFLGLSRGSRSNFMGTPTNLEMNLFASATGAGLQLNKIGDRVTLTVNYHVDNQTLTITGQNDAVSVIDLSGSSASNGNSGGNGGTVTGSTGGNGLDATAVSPAESGLDGEAVSANGDDGIGGGNGSSSAHLVLNGIVTVSTVLATGGWGGNGGAGGDGGTATGGAGGNGGNGWDDGMGSPSNGGNAGNGGAAYANGGNGGGPGQGGNGGNIQANGNTVLSFNVGGGNGGSGGAGGGAGSAAGGQPGVPGNGVNGGSSGSSGVVGNWSANNGNDQPATIGSKGNDGIFTP